MLDTLVAFDYRLFGILASRDARPVRAPLPAHACGTQAASAYEDHERTVVLPSY
jgi:hypothetical protein